jgi:hypothetical protein
MDLLSFTLANHISRSHARSAMPDAPRVPDGPPRPHRRHRKQVRRATARTLHRLADRLEPYGPSPS